jgi:hypothetical protein
MTHSFVKLKDVLPFDKVRVILTPHEDIATRIASVRNNPG